MRKVMVLRSIPLFFSDDIAALIAMSYATHLPEHRRGDVLVREGRRPPMMHVILGIPTPLSPLFLGRFSPVLRRFSAVVLCCLASWRQDGENGRKMAENGRNLGEKRARNSGG